ncbi:hypothetical protein [Streptomyces sp. NBC_01431]|uniref:hypothetical protein n=1 Tax=Streptomyces sp. NBC_01431 TaxID=2903863 RepID=UPI002E3425E5|nr:hypothetical protein [Streptomyces sp. NBC_01431]
MRTVLGAAGVGLMALGGLLVWEQTTHWDVLVWLAGAVALHDALIAPLVLGAGLLLGVPRRRGPALDPANRDDPANDELRIRGLKRRGRVLDPTNHDPANREPGIPGLTNYDPANRDPRIRGLVRGALMTAGCLILVALPVLLRPLPTANSTVLPLDYVSGLLVSLAVVAAVAVLLGVARWTKERRAARGPRDGRR